MQVGARQRPNGEPIALKRVAKEYNLPVDTRASSMNFHLPLARATLSSQK